MKTALASIALFIFLILPDRVDSQSDSPYAYLIDIQHVCGKGETGFVEFGINGNPDDYTWHWSNGATDLALAGLAPGEYTLYVENVYGCIEEYPIEILIIDNCQISIDVLPTPKPCFVQIAVTVTSNGIPLDEQALDITWGDNYPGGLTRTVVVPPGQTADQYCLEVSVPGQDVVCCLVSDCVVINGSSECDRQAKAEVIVNEFNRAQDGNQQYVELLVLGDGTCADSFDLRGFILDDNNGFIIPPNQFVNAFNLHQIGIDPGFLLFSQSPSWEHVPHGSLIIIYDETGDKHPSIPPDDPEDLDGDNVYILPADASGYLFAKTSSWDGLTGQVTYFGTLQVPSWTYLAITPPADGIQVRYPDGSYCHGISKGSSPFAGQNDFDLYLGGGSIKDQNCRLMLEDYMTNSSYDCQLYSSGYQTPGFPNSQENALMIFNLKYCGGEGIAEGNFRSASQDESVQPISDELRIYPNPTYGVLHMEYTSVMAGTAKMRLLTISGREFFFLDFHALRGSGKWEWEFPTGLPSGMYLVEIAFPTGEKIISRLSLVR